MDVDLRISASLHHCVFCVRCPLYSPIISNDQIHVFQLRKQQATVRWRQFGCGPPAFPPSFYSLLTAWPPIVEVLDHGGDLEAVSCETFRHFSSEWADYSRTWHHAGCSPNPAFVQNLVCRVVSEIVNADDVSSPFFPWGRIR